MKYNSPEPITGGIERIANTMVRELNQVIDELRAADPGVTAIGKTEAAQRSTAFSLEEKYVEAYDAGDLNTLNPPTASRILLRTKTSSRSPTHHGEIRPVS